MASYKEWLDGLFESVYVVDAQRTIIFWNKAAEAMTGFSAEEVVGRRCYDNILQHVDFQGKNLCLNGCPLQETLKDGQRREAIVLFHHKLGHRAPVRIRVSPIRDAQGRIESAIEIFEEYAKSIRVAELLDQYKNESMTDPLLRTGNRRYADTVFKLFRQQSEAMGYSFAAALIDIDAFKSVNDAWGRNVGDEVLLMVTRTASALLRPEDRLIRWGGDKFLVFWNDVDLEKLRVVADRLKTAIAGSFLDKKEGKIAVTVSMGAAMAQKGETLEEVLRKLESLLYLSKHQGSNRITFYDKSKLE